MSNCLSYSYIQSFETIKNMLIKQMFLLLLESLNICGLGSPIWRVMSNFGVERVWKGLTFVDLPHGWGHRIQAKDIPQNLFVGL